ncbi:tRNA (adenosine(37)-N6)-threonylcarbamoyltransferase complex transferase subunit TsaD [uncultured Ruminococcus sp.]|uniref:tRNA (adenosine(37)-N6)-threonylcarbamoyltransferase complex transferase subunit TsaD n=1 Tax=uncultured Ruminococcus sp. TaxID=165186 RepID=UPI0025E24023|nr:tRNA (adenosine(37)-N6)-threonylcarbamoyltransferase complex transferase subunit TsaD [uncultured Ruminococcus sp.]
MKILGIESSCDETACSVVEDGKTVLSNIVASQIDEHRLYGGVVPEIASRRHAENILWVANAALEEANCTLDDIEAIAVTYAPGLIGALLVGVSFAKGLAMSAKKPLVPVHHIAGHIASNYISHPDLEPPYLCLVASGGHSHIVEVKDYTHYHVVGRTRDDAAGECFDKAARTLGYEYPGGKFIDNAAKTGDPNAFKLPKPKVQGSKYDFSFSGLKTAVINTVHNAQQKGEEICREDMAASFQKTVADILTEKTMLAAEDLGYTTIALAGGVSANSGVRAKLSQECEKRGYKLYMPELKYCGDNGAMIACQGYYDYIAGKRADESLNGIATLSLDKISE